MSDVGSVGFYSDTPLGIPVALGGDWDTIDVGEDPASVKRRLREKLPNSGDGPEPERPRLHELIDSLGERQAHLLYNFLKKSVDMRSGVSVRFQRRDFDQPGVLRDSIVTMRFNPEKGKDPWYLTVNFA